jgi:class 3 adenylate cyclase
MKKSRPSPLELIVGPELYQRELWLGGLIVLAMVNTTVVVGLIIQAAAGPDIPGLNVGGLVAVCAVGYFVMAIVGFFGRNWRPDALLSLFVPLAPIVVLAMWFGGPNLQVSAAIIPVMLTTASVYQPRRFWLGIGAVMIGTYALMLGLADGYPQPVVRFVVVVGFAASGGVLLEWLFRHLNVLADRDRESARQLAVAHAQLADANQLLESRVDEQVGEIERLGQLRRFLTPQIAESVLSGDADSLLATHRRRIAVFFCDLRGFTRFSASSEPEDIAEVLNEYYEVLGRAIEEHGATVGGFAGDGIWAFFNDPFPVEDPAGHAFAMALSLREPMRSMRRAWESRGFVLGYGLGIAYGYATMSTIGFESRSEYTAVGSVVNLGARLCDAAADGELLIDARAYNEINRDLTGEPTTLTLKGFNDPVTAYRIVL